DTGIGIAAEDRELIFHDQVQVQPGRAAMSVPFDTTQRGTGRGLADARDLAQSMGGNIRAYSQPGLGSRFTISLPLASPGAPVASADELEGRAYLIVDQSPVRGQVLADQLRAMGADVVLADHEMAALDAVNSNTAAQKAGREYSFDMAIIAAGAHPGRAFSLAQRLREGRNAPRRVALAQNLGSALDPLAGEVADHVMTLPMTADDLLSVLRLRVIDPVEGDDSLRLTEARIADLMGQVAGLDASSALTSAASIAVVLETNPADRQHLSSLMQSHGWQVSAFAAMDKMMDRLDASADLLLIGIGNDEDDQRQALAILQSLEGRASRPPVIGLVERDMSPLARDFLIAAGFDALLDKPVSHKAMTRAIMGLASTQSAQNAKPSAVSQAVSQAAASAAVFGDRSA
ncbi:MAG: ATP-binding protein, partial [Pseudomonadota bacterium]